MSETQTLTITIPSQVAEAIQSKVASGEFSSEGEVLAASFLETEAEHDNTFGMGEEAFDAWLMQEVVPVIDEIDADPSQCLSPEQVKANMRQRHADFMMNGR